MSSMVVEFKRQEDIAQACYEASLDLNVQVHHLRDLAKRCEKYFPEIAHKLRTASGAVESASIWLAHEKERPA